MKKSGSGDTSVPPSAYTREYYTKCCDGCKQFSDTLGQELPERLSFPFQLANIQPGMRVIDIGCGRGEVILHCARQGAVVWGVDYALEAVLVAREALEKVTTPDEFTRLAIIWGNACELPFPDSSVNLAFMLDIVEHLNSLELREAISEVRRVLYPGGHLIVHTMPNLWYYHYGYPLYRFIQRIRGQDLPLDPRDRWPFRHVHVNEQTPVSLRRVIRDGGFKGRVWVKRTQSYNYELNPLVRLGMRFLTSVYPFRWIFCDDIFAVGIKK